MSKYAHRYHYVYYSYEQWGRGYIGVRSTNIEPKLDTNYFGSFSDKEFKPTEKIIIEVFTTREAAIQAEIDLHQFYLVDINSHFANKRKQTSKKFDHSERRNPMEGKTHSFATRVLIGRKIKENAKRPEYREKISRLQKRLVWWNDGLVQTRSEFCPGLNFTRGQLKQTSDNKRGKRNSMWGKRGELAPCFGRKGDKHPMFGKKHSLETRHKMSSSHGKGEKSLSFGKKWWNDGKTRRFSKECPGNGFVLGHKLNH